MFKRFTKATGRLCVAASILLSAAAYLASVAAAFLVAVACTGGWNAEPCSDLPAVELNQAETSSVSAVLSATVSSAEMVSGCGFWIAPAALYDDGGIPALCNDGGTVVHTAEIGEHGEISCNIKELEPETEYVCIAFVENGVSRIMSSVVRFKTPPVSGSETEPEDPEEPDVPDEPDEPEDPEEPDVPDEPDEPEEPDVPDVPYVPLMPASPEMVQHYPDPVLRDYLLIHYDLDSDGDLSEDEERKVNFIEIRGDYLADIHGIERLPGLTHLSLFASGSSHTMTANGKLTSLDVSHNPMLTVLHVECQPISSIDLSNNPQLMNLSLFLCPIDTLDVSANTKLEMFGTGSCRLSHVDLSHNTMLKEVHIENNGLKSLIMGGNPSVMSISICDNKLETLDISGCPLLDLLDVLRNPKLKTIYTSSRQHISTMRLDKGMEVITVD